MNTPTALPRSKEGMRRTLENKLLFATIGSQKVKFGNSHGKSLRALVRPRKPNFNTEQEYRDDDIKRRRGIEQIMEARVKAGLEKDGEHLKWREIAEVDDKYAELEGEHRAWILAELNARVGNEPRENLEEYGICRKAERRLLSDTIALPNHDGIPRKRFGWLHKVLTPKELTAQPEKAEQKATIREQAVNYIAACRRQAGVCEDFEMMRRNRKVYFEDVKRDMTVEDLERTIWPELNEKVEEDSANCSYADSDDGVQLGFEPGFGQTLTEEVEVGDRSAKPPTTQDNSTATLALRPKSTQNNEQVE